MERITTECERLVEQVRAYTSSYIEGKDTPGGCRISLPLLEPSGDVVYVTVRGGPGGFYRVTDGGRLQGILFESNLSTPQHRDRESLASLARRFDLEFDHDRRVFFADFDGDSLGYGVFEVGRTIATMASALPSPARKRGGPKLSSHVISQISHEFNARGLLGFGQVSEHRRVLGVTSTERRVDFSYRRKKPLLGEPESDLENVFVIAADLRNTPVKQAQNAVVVAHDLSGRDDKPMVRVVHGLVESESEPEDRFMQDVTSARRLIESVATSDRIEEYSWDDAKRREELVAVTMAELAA